jgi:hypothetical protein
MAFRIKSEARKFFECLITVERYKTTPWSAHERRDFALCLTPVSAEARAR